MKKMVTMWVAVMFILSLIIIPQITTTAATSNGQLGASVNYTFNDVTGALSITGTGAMWDNVASPFPKTQVKTVTIANGVTSIGASVFYDCPILISVTIPNSVTKIGSSAFENSGNIQSLTIPASVSDIGTNAFTGVNNMTSFTVNSSNSTYKSVNGVLYSKDGKTLIHMGVQAGNENFTVPAGVTRIERRAFGYCNKLANVIISKDVIYIGDSSFIECTNLVNITIPQGVKSIDGTAFAKCSSLESVNIPASVTSIGIRAFLSSNNMNSFTVDSSNTNYKTIDGVLYSKDGKTLIHMGVQPTNGNFTVPAGVVTIAEYSFSQCQQLKTVTISQDVTSIGLYAFGHSFSLKSIIVPQGVTNIEPGAFYALAATKIIIPKSVTNIGYQVSGSTMSLCFIAKDISDITIGSPNTALRVVGWTPYTISNTGAGVRIDIEEINPLTVKKYASGVQNEAYFATGGTVFIGNTIDLTSGVYTFYSKDLGGNETVQQFEVVNSGSITIRVKNQNGQPVSGANVKIEQGGV